MKNIVVLFVIVLLAGCVSQSQILMNNQGQGVRCPSSGYGLAGMMVSSKNQNNCVEDYKRMGYVEIEKVGVTGIMRTEDCSVIKVFKDSPADRAGMKVGDVIERVNGQPVRNNKELTMAALGLAGNPVELKVRRDKARLSFKIVRGQRTKIAATK